MPQTNNYVQKFVTGGTLTDSIIFDNGKIGISTNNPSGLLDVKPTGNDDSFILFQPSVFTQVDSTSWDVSMVRVGRDMGKSGASLGAANQFGLTVQTQVPSTGSTAHYQKGALMAWIRTADCFG